LVSYLRCVFTDPGSVPTDVKFNTFERKYENGVETVRECKICNGLKPDRAHHCRTCQTCVLKMDHHCPWVNNCVGYRNYKYFILFLSYTSFLCLYYMACTTPLFFNFSDIQKLTTDQLHVLIVYFVCISFGLGLLCFSIQHIQLTLQNKTTIESFDKKMDIGNPYDLGKSLNFEQVFGNKFYLWLLPIFTGTGNGYEWEKNGDIENFIRPPPPSKKKEEIKQLLEKSSSD